MFTCIYSILCVIIYPSLDLPLCFNKLSVHAEITLARQRPAKGVVVVDGDGVGPDEGV